MPKFNETKVLDTFHHNINYEDWMASDYWSFSEAALLAYGHNPDEDNINLNPYGTKMISYPSQLPSYSQKLLRIMERSGEVIFQEQIDRVSAIKFVDWLIQRGIEIPQALMTAYEKKKLSSVDYKAQCSVLREENENLKRQLTTMKNNSATTKINQSLMTILGAILLKHYPPSNRDTVSKISRLITDHYRKGLDEETISSRIEDAVSFIKEKSHK